MVFRRKSRKRTFHRKRKSQAKFIARIARKTIKRAAEHKRNELSLDLAPYANAVPVVAGVNAFVTLCSIPQGVTNATRLADIITASLRVKGMVRNLSATDACVLRVCVVVDTAQSNLIGTNVAPINSQIFANPTDLLSHELVVQRRYNIIHNRVYNLGPSISGSGQKMFSFSIKKRKIYFSGVAAALADNSKGHPYILLECENAAQAQQAWNAVTFFTDM